MSAVTAGPRPWRGLASAASPPAMPGRLWAPLRAWFGRRAAPVARSAGGTAIRFRLAQIEGSGWSVEGGDSKGCRVFATLRQAVLFARDECDAGAAIIELHMGDFVAVVHQIPGWPKSICGETV